MIQETEVDFHNLYMRTRVGFLPSVLLQVVGTSFENRAGLLKKASIFCTPEYTPPCMLERQPDNLYDDKAVAVFIGVSHNTLDGWEMAQAGFLPKNYSISTYSGEKACVWELMDKKIGTVQIGIDGIYSQGGGIGLRVGLLHDE